MAEPFVDAKLGIVDGVMSSTFEEVSTVIGHNIIFASQAFAGHSTCIPDADVHTKRLELLQYNRGSVVK